MPAGKPSPNISQRKDSSGETCNYLPADITDSPCGDARLPVSEMAEAAKGDAGLRWQMLEDFVRQGGGSLVSMVPEPHLIGQQRLERGNRNGH